MPGCGRLHRAAIPLARDATITCMTIAPPSDIVLDTLMAADPAKSQAVAEKLHRLRPSRVGDFDTAMVDPASATSATGATDPSATLAALAQRPAQRIDASASARNAIPPAYRKFEAFVLQTFIEAMLPRDSTVNFGKGVAGDVWRSMMAEQLGNSVAKAGGVGIAKFLAAAHPGESGRNGLSRKPLMETAGAQALATAASAPARSAAAAMLDDLAAKT
jgi:peptidoglycan hydrolase FlgJ